MEKLINYVFLNGKKKLNQNYFLKITKNLQKKFNKNSKNLFKLFFIVLVQFFKINDLKNNKQKKATFLVLYKNKNWTFLTIKFLIQAIKKKLVFSFFKKLYQEIISIIHKNSFYIKTKAFLQNQVILKKHLFFYFRWR